MLHPWHRSLLYANLEGRPNLKLTRPLRRMYSTRRTEPKCCVQIKIFHDSTHAHNRRKERMLVNKRVLRMKHTETIQFQVPSNPPRIEFDTSVGAWYIRFLNSAVVKSISKEGPGVVSVIDLDSNNRVVGFELIGVKQFSIKLLRGISPINTSKIDFDRARFMHASNRKCVSA